ncbi:MAG: diphosphate--fructose-6-phosphate 1-phosphotransferase [Chlamydiales bacterium]
MSDESRLAQERCKFQPSLPHSLKIGNMKVIAKEIPAVSSEIKKLFPYTYAQPIVELVEGKEHNRHLPLKVGVVLSGGQAPGGHNVIVGLYETLKKLHSSSELFGFVGGPAGIIDKRFKHLDRALVDQYRNSGGFDLIGSGRTKIESEEQIAASLQTVQSMKLDGIVIIGGDDSNTNAAVLAEYFLEHGCTTRVIGVPKTIDGDLKNEYVETSFGFDTAAKVYAELIGNICRDALSARKYYHFVRLMGRSASHITLECALQTHPNFTVIGEEVAAKNLTLSQVITAMVDLIVKRAAADKNFGVVLIPEGLLEFVPEIKQLLRELNAGKTLSKQTQQTYDFLPKEIQEQLMMDRDPHGNVQLSHIATEKLIVHLVREGLHKRKEYNGKFNAVTHFFGYEGRCSFPSNFDSNYCFALGAVAASLIDSRQTGYMCAIQNLAGSTESWRPGGIPITMLMHIEERKGKQKPVIEKALVDLEGTPYQTLLSQRSLWGFEERYRFPGPIQLFGPEEICNEVSITLELEQKVKVSK